MRSPETRPAAEERDRLALEASGAGTFHWDRRTGEVDWDASLELIYGLSPGSFGGQFEEWVALIHPEDRDEVLARLDTSTATGEAYSIAHRLIRPDGGLAWVECRGKPILDDDGEVVGMVGACHDVTERQATEAERARLLTAEQDARERLEFLVQASGVLGNSLDAEETLDELAWLAVPRLGDWCTVDLLEGGTLRRAAVAHADSARAESLRELSRRYGYVDDHGPGKVIRTGEAEVLKTIPEDLLVGVAEDDEHLQRLRDLSPVSAMVVPLTARRRVLGALTLVHAESGRTHEDDDVDAACELAQRAAIAVDNAALFAERARVAAKLQEALLPPNLPDIPGVELAARYDAAQHGDIGGDFYDVINLRETWMVVVGDVAGKGTAAASATALARHTVRTAALHDPDPAHVLRVLNDAFLDEHPERFCTAVCAHVSLSGEQVRMTLAAGGHPSPVIARTDGRLERPSCWGTLLGLFDRVDLDVVPVTLQPDDLVLFYTDGLSEARQDNELFGVEGIEAALASMPGTSAQGALERLHGAMEGHRYRQTDDMAMIAFRRRR